MSFLDRFKRTGKPSLQDELTAFYEKNKTIVFHYFYRITGSSEQSEELTQETFYQAVKSIHRFKGHSTLKTWLLQIARNVYRNKVRTWTRDRAFYSEEDVESHGDYRRNPERLSIEKLTKDHVRNILLAMPEDYRDVLILKEIEGLSHAEIAKILGKNPQTTKVLLYRAKQKFKELYNKEVSTDEKSL